MDIRSYFVTNNKIAWYKFNANHFCSFATNFSGPCWPNDKMQVLQWFPAYMQPVVEMQVPLCFCPWLEKSYTLRGNIVFVFQRAIRHRLSWICKRLLRQTLALLRQSPKRAKAMKVKCTESS